MLLHRRMENANKSALYVDRISKAGYTECSVLKSTYRKQPLVQATHLFTKCNQLVTLKDELLQFKTGSNQKRQCTIEGGKSINGKVWNRATTELVADGVR